MDKAKRHRGSSPSSSSIEKKARSEEVAKTNKGPATPDQSDGSDGVVKSPLDTHGYQIKTSTDSSLKGLLVSTCVHSCSVEKKAQCTFSTICDFNNRYANFNTRAPPPGGTPSSDTPAADDEKNPNPVHGSPKAEETYEFGKAKRMHEKSSQLKRTRPKVFRYEHVQREGGKKLPKAKKPKCRRGSHEQDDEMQTFCNTKCIAVLYVKTGMFQDPKDVPGMAHLCEHLLCLASKNYPETEAFTKFVEAEGGWYNAATFQEFTIYYFYINHEKIAEALDMFADMFANPEWTMRDLKKEIDNVNSEFQIKRLRDDLRHRILVQSCALQDHPASNFGMGSKDTLTVEPPEDRGTGDQGRVPVNIEKVRKWIEKYYFAENMMFALQGPLPLPELEKLYDRFSSKIPHKRKEPGEVTASRRQPDHKSSKVRVPFDKKKWNQLYHMDIAGTTTFMTVSWVLDPKFGKNYATKPIHYFSYIFNHKGKGSLDWYLKKEGWITALMVTTSDSPDFCTKYYTNFTLYMELTSDGLRQRSNILNSVFDYVDLLKRKGASEEIFNEIRQVQADIFHYRSDLNLSDPTFGRKFDPTSVNDTLWNMLHVLEKTDGDTGIPSDDVLLSLFLIRHFDEDLLTEFIEELKPSRAMVVYAAQSFAKEANKQEKWCETKYFTTPMPEWKKSSSTDVLRFPRSNPFISVSMCYPERDEKRDNIEKGKDLLAYESAKGYLTYGNTKCQKGWLPSAEYILDFQSPALEDDTGDLVNIPNTDIFILLLKYTLEIQFGSALSSLISYDVDYIPGGIRTILSGPSAKLPELARMVINTIENFQNEAALYTKMVEDFRRVQCGVYRDVMNDPDSCSKWLLSYVLAERAHFLSDFIVMLAYSTDHDDFLTFVDDFKRRLFVSGDLNGCVSKSQATAVAKMVDKMKTLPYRRKMEDQTINRCVLMPAGERCLLVAAKNTKDRTVVVRNYYQVGKLDTVEQRLILEAITAYLAEAAFEELRTKQSLGYHAEADMYSLGGTYGVTVFVQGAADKHACGYINERIDDFMEVAYENSLSSKKAFQENIEVWLNEGQKINYETAQMLYKDRLLPSESRNSRFRKLSVQIQGYPKNAASAASVLKPTQVKKKVEAYQSSVKLVRCPGDGAHCGLSRYSTYLKLMLKDIQEENGYFITDVQKFKLKRPCYGDTEDLEEEFENN